MFRAFHFLSVSQRRSKAAINACGGEAGGGGGSYRRPGDCDALTALHLIITPMLHNGEIEMNPWFKTLAAATCIVGDEARRTKKPGGAATAARRAGLIAVLGGSLALSAEPAAAWCNYYGDCYYNDGGAAIGGAMLGFALGAMAGAAAAQQQQTQQQVPVCYASNGNPYFARAWHGRWRC